MNTLIRAFVVALALTGAFASTQISSASTPSKITMARVSVLPVPTCDPHVPSACGLGQH